MLLSEFVKLPYSAKLLAMYLHVSNPTYKKLVTGQVVQRSVIILIAPKLQRETATIIADLDALKLTQQRFQPPMLAVDQLSLTTTNPKHNAEIHASTFFLAAAIAPNSELIVCATKASSTMQTRVNHSLYAGHWQQFEECPRQQLTSDQLVTLSKYFGHKLPKSVALVFHNIHYDRFITRWLPYLSMIALLVQQHQKQSGLQFVITDQLDGTGSHQVDRLLKQLENLIYEELGIRVAIEFESSASSLMLQAADIFARTLVKLPENEWPMRVVMPVKYETLATQALFKTIMHMKV